MINKTKSNKTKSPRTSGCQEPSLADAPCASIEDRSARRSPATVSLRAFRSFAETSCDTGPFLGLDWVKTYAFEHGGRRRMKRPLLAGLLVDLLGFGYYFRGFVFDKGADTQTARPPAGQTVVADVAVEMPAPIQISAIGTVQPIAMVIIQARVDGEIAQVHFEEGQEVKEGDILFSLDDRALRAQLAQSEATLERDRAQLQRARLEVTRQGSLAGRGIASAQKFEDVETSVAVFETKVRARQAGGEKARVNLKLNTNPPPPPPRHRFVNPPPSAIGLL